MPNQPEPCPTGALFDDSWTACSIKLPEAKTPVFIIRKGKLEVGAIFWELPAYAEEAFGAYKYWDDPYNTGQGWDFDDVTHWKRVTYMTTGALIKPYSGYLNNSPQAL